MATIMKTADVAPCSLVGHHHHHHHHLWHDSPLWTITFLLWISWLQALYWVGCHHRAQPPPWMTRPPYLWPPETGWPSYTPGHWVPILVVFYDTHELRWDYSYPPVTHGKVWQIMCINMFDSDTIHFNASLSCTYGIIKIYTNSIGIFRRLLIIIRSAREQNEGS
jgi:hypothetical protein